MTKFTKFESATIIASLNNSKSADLGFHQKVVEAGRTPIMTTGYIEQTYAELIQKVEEMTKKK